jgi:acetyl esterase/lipase
MHKEPAMNSLNRCLRRPPAFLAVLLTASITVLALVQMAPAQPAPSKAAVEKRPLTHNDYDNWRTIQTPLISPNGQFVAYTINSPGSGSELVVVELDSKTLAIKKTMKDVRGKGTGDPEAGKEAGEVPAAKGGKGGAADGGGGGKAAFTADSARLVFTIAGGKKGGKGGAAKKAELDQEKAKAAPQQASLGVMDLSTGKVTTIPGVRSFQLPEDNGAGVVYLKVPTPAAGEEKKGDLFDDEEVGEDFLQAKQGKGKKGGGAPGGGKQGPGQAAAKSIPSDLVIHSFLDGSDNVIPDVTEFMLTRDGRLLLCVIAPKEADEGGVFAFFTSGGPNSLNKMPLVTGKAKYSRFTWDEKQSHLAFFVDRSTSAKEPGTLSLYMWDRGGNTKPATPGEPLAIEVLNSKMTTGLKDGCVLIERGGLSFSEDGSKLFLGVAPPAPPPEKETPAKTPGAKDDTVIVELWHWKDDFIQPMQKARGLQDKLRTYTAVFHVKSKRLVQLADKSMPLASMSHDGNTAIGSDDTIYRPLVAYDGNYSDIFLVNSFDGSRKPLLKKHHWGVSFSPSGRYAIFYDGKDWNTISLSNGSVNNITKKITGTSFTNEDHDSPSASPSYGIAGWSADEYNVLLYDKYDIWEVSTAGNGFRNLTAQVGRKADATFRYVKLDPKEKGIDMSKPMMLKLEKLQTRESGFALLDPRGKGPVVLNVLPASLGVPTKAKHADRLLFTAQSFYLYPDLWVASMDFKQTTRVSDANPQKNNFIWGIAEMVHYKNADGVPLSGVLVKPENFDPTKKYPMIVYIYEKLSQNLNHFVVPKEGTSINPTYYASNGYLVFMPDIVYTTGYPGQSALKCVLPAIQAVVDKGFVNEDAIGIQGHSWGGYQIAYMVTQTGRFKAAAAGAPVSNMTSAYDGIRWGTGMPRQFQYEKTQSRIGGTLWEFPMRFVENSPVFMADRVKTPLMILHNDHDDAVPWYQGIEYYLALRRLGKEVYMFNYPDELHGLRKKANQKDYTIRMQQFFDHYLRGMERPQWMVSGIPYAPRGATKDLPPSIPDDN